MSDRFLLDTHVLLWAIAEPSRLSPAARGAIVPTENQLFVSAASAWELATKHRLGKLPGAEVILGDYKNHVETLGASDIPIASVHGRAAGLLDVAHRDPFDRMIGVQASMLGLTLISADPAFNEFKALGLSVLW